MSARALGPGMCFDRIHKLKGARGRLCAHMLGCCKQTGQLTVKGPEKCRARFFFLFPGAGDWESGITYYTMNSTYNIQGLPLAS